MEIKVKVKLSPGAVLPEYHSEGASGADVRALLAEPLEVAPGSRCAVPTGVYVEVPEGYEVQVRPRSGLAAREGLTVLNTPGTIDSDYRGEIVVILINHGTQVVRIASGDRIAQLVVCPVVHGSFERVESLSETARGEGGFGHTGMH